MLLNAMFSHHETDFIAISQISPSTAKNGSTARRRVLLVFLFEPSFFGEKPLVGGALHECPRMARGLAGLASLAAVLCLIVAILSPATPSVRKVPLLPNLLSWCPSCLCGRVPGDGRMQSNIRVSDRRS
jgi:hypothetical protein